MHIFSFLLQLVNGLKSSFPKTDLIINYILISSHIQFDGIFMIFFGKGEESHEVCG